ncbi:MAG TPA: 23S rRNA (uracil(1939)-C(5))-methyltransferase RlmD [Pseudogracilibacillus sp.]|nr:23S rRNA (uracil(1939)-C(5))-methyltransferase RlmD [Pseudogracilibacillus sp.]
MAKEKRRPPVKKNDEIIVTCEDLTHEGNGVVKVDNYPLFIQYLLPGEKAKVRVVKANKNFGYGKLLSIESRSDARVEPPCNVFYRCGGCQIQHMDYNAQLEMKRNNVVNNLKRIGHLDDVTVHAVLGMEDPWYYRNKIQMPVGEKNGSLITGFYRERSHQIIPDMDTCLIQNKYGDEIIDVVREIANDLHIDAYDEKNHRGVLRHIIVRTAYETNETMIILVTKTKKLPHEAEMIKQLTEKRAEIKSIIHNVNPARTNVILGNETRTIYGEDYIYDRIGSLKFKLSAKSFFQVNPTQTKVLYEQALAYAQVGENDIVIDAYCGIGSISLFLAKRAKKVYGVEIVPEAIEDAKENAKLNNINNIEFTVGKAEEVMPKWKKDGLQPNVIVVDPPRKGCDEKLLQAMIDMEPERIVYVSCNPATLARDLRILEDGGYKTQEVQPVDMFSQTYHVECVSLLQRETI